MGVSSEAVRAAYELAFQISPIVLVDGLAGKGSMLPIIALSSEVLGILQGVVSGTIAGNPLSLNAAPFNFQIAPGGTMISQSPAMYPFANRNVASNSVVYQPNVISMLMIAPVMDYGGYLTKLALMTSFVTALETHNQLGGTYIVATPAKIYRNGVMSTMRFLDAPTQQVQIQYQLDFVFPLVTQTQSQAAQSALMSALSGGQKLPKEAGWSGLGDALSGGVSQLPGALAGLGL